tara:strand:- start:1153 stop:2514 length:1362 start_codon:yes stop_codon:yes gene_type:complete
MLNLYNIISDISLKNTEIKYKQRIPKDFMLYTLINNKFYDINYIKKNDTEIKIVNNNILNYSSIIFSNYRKAYLNRTIFVGKGFYKELNITIMLSKKLSSKIENNNINIKYILTKNLDIDIIILKITKKQIKIQIVNKKNTGWDDDLYLFFPDFIKIPRNIYYTLPNKDLLSQPITNSIVSHNKNITFGYKDFFYDDNDCINFIKKNFDDNVYISYCQIIPGAYKADFWRLCILYIYGGIYIDLGFKICEDLDKILNYNDLVLVKDRNDKDIFNAFICCIPKHPFIKFCIDELCYKINNFEYGDNPLDFSGPSFIGKMFEKWNNNDNVFFLYHSNNGKNIVTKENKSIIETKNGPLLFESKYNKNRICAFRKEFTSSIHNEIESYHYDILWEDRKVFFNIYYDSWSKTAKDYHIKDGYLYCRLKDLSGNWIENRKKILPFTKYCNINGQIQEE